MASDDPAKPPSGTNDASPGIGQRSEARYLLEQAAMARREADATSLPNVRLRELNAAAAWTRLAEAATRREQFGPVENDQIERRTRRGPTPMGR